MFDYVGAWNKRELDELVSFFDQDALYEDHGLGTAVRGKGAIRRYLADVFAALPDATMMFAASPLVGDDRACIEWVMSGTEKGELAGTRPGDRRFEVRGASVMAIEHGKIVKKTDYFDLATLAGRRAIEGRDAGSSGPLVLASKTEGTTWGSVLEDEDNVSWGE
ncbi:MAG: ester cyclase [Chloroflexota bacterium]|nr:ester cyclase [Chloroflexota bacterium]